MSCCHNCSAPYDEDELDEPKYNNKEELSKIYWQVFRITIDWESFIKKPKRTCSACGTREENIGVKNE